MWLSFCWTDLQHVSISSDSGEDNALGSRVWDLMIDWRDGEKRESRLAASGWPCLYGLRGPYLYLLYLADLSF